MTFGGGNPFFKATGSSDLAHATRLVDICIDHGVTMFDTADIYSNGLSEEILGRAIAARRNDIIISTKVAIRSGTGPNDIGASRYHLIRSCEASLRRLGTDHIDIYLLHAFDSLTPVEETLSTLETLVRSGKVRYIGCSNYSGWHLMKSLAASDRLMSPRFVAHQAYYSLVGRDYENELMPLAVDQGVGTMVWSPLGWGRLTGKLRRGEQIPQGSRLHETSETITPPSDEYTFGVIDALNAISGQTGKSVPQIALNWLMQRPTISTIILGARTEDQLKQNLGSVGWRLDAEHLDLLERASSLPVPYPYWQQKRVYCERIPPL
jgi:aryl-alcohol dehydrogenase-like predicted oxidoreductase